MHDEVARFVHCCMELCILLTTDETLDRNHDLFSLPGELDPIIEEFLSPDKEIPWYSSIVALQAYKMQIMPPEQQRKRLLFLGQQSDVNQAPDPSNQILPSASSHSSASTQSFPRPSFRLSKLGGSLNLRPNRWQLHADAQPQFPRISRHRLEICHAPVSAPQRASKIALPNSSKN